MLDTYWNCCQISDGVLYYTDLRPTEKEVHSMNTTFKIVFNKARGALMVANEITGSVQKKGMQTIVVSAISLLTLGIANATPTVIVAPGTTVTGNVAVGADHTGWWGGKYSFTNEDVVSNNVLYKDVVFSAKDGGPMGGVIHIYAMNTEHKQAIASFTNDQFINNTLLSSGTNSKATDWSAGGVVNIKGGNVSFNDVIFSNNKVNSSVSGNGVVTVGGAVFLDQTRNSVEVNGVKVNANVETTATFNINRDLTYAGNTILNTNEKATTTVYGGKAYSSGGFLFMDRHSTANFNVSEGATLTLGMLNSSDKNADTIASSMTTDADATTNGGHNLITKQGAGTFVINSSLNDYNGLVNVENGSMVVNSDWKIRNAVTINGGTLDLSNSDFKFSSVAECATDLDPEITIASTAKGTLTLQSGTLIAKIGNVFNDAEGDATLDSTEVTQTKGGFTFKSGTLALSDPGSYKAGLYNSIVSQINNRNVDLNFINATLVADNDVPLQIRQDTSVAGISGENLEIISAGLSIAGENQSSLGTVTLIDAGAIAAKDGATVKIDVLSGMGKVSVGEHNGTNAHMSVNKLDMNGGSLFIDPYYGESTLAVASLSGGVLNTNVTAGTGALVTFGTDVASAKNAISKLDGFSDLESVVYVGTKMTLGADGSIVIDPQA